MAHWSEDSKRLQQSVVNINKLSLLESIPCEKPGVYLFWLPFPRMATGTVNSKEVFSKIAEYCGRLNEDSVVCVLTTPPDAAEFLPYLEKSLEFQLWVAVKTTLDAYPGGMGSLPRRHASLLILTRYKKSLSHTKTRIQYTYCPACGKTTKDYGGKKHTYHEYGTLLSDVWRDIDCNPTSDIRTVTDRLRDLFGLPPYQEFYLVDLRNCEDIISQESHSSTLTGRYIDETEANPSLDSELLNEDCLKALASIPDNSVDFCFADPPYNLKKKYDKWDDALESVKYFAWCDNWLSELCRVLKPGRTLAVLNIPLWAVRHYQHLISIMNFQAWIAWESLSFPVRMIMPSHYVIMCFSKGFPRPLPGLSQSINDVSAETYVKPLQEFYCVRTSCVANRQRLSNNDRSNISDVWYDIHRLKHNSRRVDHPCQLPPLLMRRLFALFTHPCEMILDCFNGAGTSTLVAQQMNRSYIGIELSQQYHGIALQRHGQIERGGNPFGKADIIPAAKNSPVQRLPKQKYEVTKKELQLDVKRIAYELGRLPTRKEVQAHSRFPIEYFDKYFISWGEVCAAARTTGMTELPKDRRPDSGQLELLFGTAKQN
jgi:DNA modification methylase